MACYRCYNGVRNLEKVGIMVGFRSLTSIACLLGFLPLFPTFLVAGNDHPSRVSYVDGTVAIGHEGSSDWEILERNFPVWEGDRIISERNSRVEIEFNDGTVVRLGSRTGLVFEKSSQEKVIVQLLGGDLMVHKSDGPPFQVVSSDSTTDLKEEGVYRFQLVESGETTVRVRKGLARTVQGAVSVSIREGDAWRVGGAGPPVTRLYGSAQRDGFDLWNDLRNALRRVQYPPSSMPYTRYAGSRDLNRYGQWGYVSSYGRVWWPHEHSEWIPYQRGRWVEGPLGELVWISDEPWGWLPYHYGNWVYIGDYSRWCWVPGHFYRWQAALVGFHLGGGYPEGSRRQGSILDQGRPHRQPGLPSRLGTRVQNGHHLSALRPSPRNVTFSKPSLPFLKRPESSFASDRSRRFSRSPTLVRRGMTSFVAPEVNTPKSERAFPILRSRSTRPSSNPGKVKMFRHSIGSIGAHGRAPFLAEPSNRRILDRSSRAIDQ